ncbi:MAG: hypothetical protein ACJARZ_000410 [Dokdonia sp.]|jgi:hypothetical protein
MEYIISVIKIVIAASIINVWLFRFNQSTVWRGGNAGNMKQEFGAYGLPLWLMYVIGGLKVVLSLSLLASIYFTQLEQPSAFGLAILMLGAIGMHMKISDPIKKSLPAIIFLVLSLIVALVP